MNNLYCKHGNHHAIRCLLCEQEGKGKKNPINTLLGVVDAIEDEGRRESLKKRIEEASKRLGY